MPPRLDYRAQASPSHEPLLSKLSGQLKGPFGMAWGLMVGRCGFTSHEGITLSRGWLCQKWKPMDILGTHLQYAMQLLNSQYILYCSD